MKSPLNCFKFIYVMFVIFDILMYDNATIIRIAISIDITANIIKQTNVHMKSTKDIMTWTLTERNKNTIKPALMGSGGRREKCWGISCEKSQFYAKKSYFFQF